MLRVDVWLFSREFLVVFNPRDTVPVCPPVVLSTIMCICAYRWVTSNADAYSYRIKRLTKLFGLCNFTRIGELD